MASISEILLAQGERAANARRRMGEISANTWANLGNIAGNAVQSYANEKAQEPIRQQEQRIRNLQLEGAEAEAASRRAAGQTEQTFQQTLGSGRSRAEILKALEARPELYERASKHFKTIDDNFNRYMGSVAASVRDFDDDPEAAMVALDDLIAQGFDERQMDRYRQAIQQDPTNVSQLIDGLLSRSPDETHRALVKPKKELGTRQITVRNPDGSETVQIVPDTPGQTFQSAAAPKPMREVVVKGPNGRPMKKLVTEEELLKGVEQYQEPRVGSQPSYQWALDPRDGQVRLMTPDEIRASGAGQAPTADMRNKEKARPAVNRGIAKVRQIGADVFQRVGPAQRAEAIKRGAEAVFGNDAVFRTYQDARMATAGALAVEQQGSRVSDADVKAMWLPLIPDAYRDTKDSWDLKWEVIDAMRGADVPQKIDLSGQADLVYDPKTKTFKKAGGG